MVLFFTEGGTWREVLSCTSPPPQVGVLGATWRNIQVKTSKLLFVFAFCSSSLLYRKKRKSSFCKFEAAK